MTKGSGKMTLARALKEKERISRRLARASELFMSVNCVRAGEPREVDAKEAYEAMQSIQRRHVAMKKAIAVANAGVSPILAEMLVVKAELKVKRVRPFCICFTVYAWMNATGLRGSLRGKLRGTFRGGFGLIRGFVRV